MYLSCCVWALSLPEDEVLRQLHALGLHRIDIQPDHLRDGDSRELASTLGLRVSCLGASFGMPEDAALDDAIDSRRQRAITYVKLAIDHAAEVGASTAYIVPCQDGSPVALRRFGDSLVELADHAESQGIRLAVEHFPGAALPTALATLEFVRDLRHQNLYLLYDSGHIQISDEDPTAIILASGDRLGYLHFDDNDGEGDLHLALFDGVMTADSLSATFEALRAIDYNGGVSLELNRALPDVLDGIRRSRDVILPYMYS